MQEDYVEMPHWVVLALDKILNYWKENGSKHAVETKKDWEVVRSVFQLWKKAYPHEYQDFMASMRATRSAHIDKYGSSGGKRDDGQVRHIAEVPGRFDGMLKIFYPEQIYSKPFVRKLVKEIPDFQAPDKV